MNIIKPLNQEIGNEIDNIEEIIKELSEKQEFACTAYSCPIDVIHK